MPLGHSQSHTYELQPVFLSLLIILSVQSGEVNKHQSRDNYFVVEICSLRPGTNLHRRKHSAWGDGHT